MLTLPLIVYGSGSLYRELFNAIAASVGDSGYSDLIRLAIIVTGTWVIFNFSRQRSMQTIVHWLLAYYVAFYIVFLPKAQLQIIDEINLQESYSVANIPLGLAIVASYASRIGAGLTALMEKTFSLPDDITYQHTGLVMASRLAVASTQFAVPDPNFQASLQSFVQQCIFYDLLLHKYTLSDLANSTDIWQFVSKNASPARAFKYDGQIVTCQAGAQQLAGNWQAAINQAAGLYGARFFPNSATAKDQLLTDLPQTYSYLSLQKISQDGAQLMQQNMMANAIQNGVLHFAANINAPAALESYAFAKAQLQKRLTNMTVAEMAVYWLPIMQNIFMAILYGAFVFIFLLMLFPFGGSIVRYYIASIFWVQLWAPLYAIINLFMNFYAAHKSAGALQLLNGQSGLTLSSQAGFAQVNADVSSMAGYLSLSVPFLAAGLMRGMMQVIPQVAQYIGGVTQGAASGAAAEAAGGNLSLGNVNYGNLSANNTSANHFDTSGRVSSGMYTTQMPQGSTLTETAGGRLVMSNQGAISQLGVTANLAQSLRAAYTKQAEQAESAAFNEANAYSTAATSAMRSIYELGHHQGTSQTSGESWSYSTGANVSHALNNIQRLTDRFAHDHRISTDEAANVLSSAYANASVGVNTKGTLIGEATGIQAGASAGVRHDASHSNAVRDDNVYAAAQDYVKDTSYGQNMDTVTRALDDKSLRTSDEAGQRLVDNAAASWDNAQTARNEMTHSLQQAESYREMASLTEENSATINSNASQIVFDYLQKQGMSTETIEEMMTENPEEAMAMANAAIQPYMQELSNGWGKELPESKQAVSEAYHESNNQIAGKDTVKQDYQHNKAQIQERAQAENVTQPVDTTVKQKVKDFLADKNQEIQKENVKEDKQEQQFKQHIDAEQGKKRDHGILKNFFVGTDTKD